MRSFDNVNSNSDKFSNRQSRAAEKKICAISHAKTRGIKYDGRTLRTSREVVYIRLRILGYSHLVSSGEIEKDITSPGGLMLIFAGKATLKGCVARRAAKAGIYRKGTAEREGWVRSDPAWTN